MTTLPALEAALDEAAHRYYGARRRRWPLVLVPATAIAAAVAALALALPGRALDPAQVPAGDQVVPPETLALSTALALAPDVPQFQVDDPPIPHAELPALADGFEDGTPYPPGRRDTFDWLSTASGPYDMSSINYAREVRTLVEWRSACIWLRFWLDAGDAERTAAGVVLTNVPKWPTLRDRPGNWADVPGQIERGDGTALALQYQHDCSPWRDRQGG